MGSVEAGVWPVVCAEEMQALDRFTIDQLGVPGEVLMESAGRAVVEAALAELDRLREEDGSDALAVSVVCGLGNNGGDGFVVARHLSLLGVSVELALVGDPAKLKGDAALNFARAKSHAVAIRDESWQPPPRGLLVDALFGTGLGRDLVGPARDAVERINAARNAGCRVVAVDLPSGLDADTGQVRGAAVNADRTVTIGLPKLGLALEPGRSLAGEVTVARIGIADRLPGHDSRAELWTAAAAGKRLPERPAAGHKGSFGHVLLVAGSEGKTGAAALAATASSRAGAGLVTLACPGGLNDILEVKCTEAMTVPVAETAERSFSAAAEKELLSLAAERDVVAAGPGVGRGPEAQALMRALGRGVDRPLVLDADGVIAFANDAEILKGRGAPTILTPHPGEAARLLGMGTAEINRDRVAVARQLAEQTGAVVVLKGAATVTAAPDGRVIVNPTGGPALATGGTGDVLLGIVAAYVGQGLDAFQAAALSAYVHGAAADSLARELGTAGMLAGDLAAALPPVAEVLRQRARETDSAHFAPGVPSIGSRLSLAFPGPGVHR